MTESSSHNNRTAGRLLENTRREIGLSLEEAASRTGIPASILEGLEREGSAPFHSRVFLRNYADSLGLDYRTLSRHRKPEGQAEEAPTPETLSPEMPTPETPPSKVPPWREAPSREAPSREAPSREAPSREAPSREAPSHQETPSQEAPQAEAPPSQDTVTQEVATQETPLQEGRTPFMVEARGVYKSYRAEEHIVHALEGVSLRIEKGALVAVMGPSGCGKTTLLNVLSGLDGVDRGEIFIAGEPLHALNDARRTGYRARHMGFIFQGFNLMPVLSAVENVELPLLVAGVGVKAARKRALEVLEQVRLADRAYHRPNQLSGGQQQRVAIARALVNQPAIVWADEPTGNLDSDTSREVLDLLLQLNRENGQTFVVVTHDPGVGKLMDRVVRMRDGRIVGEDREGAEAAPGA